MNWSPFEVSITDEPRPPGPRSIDTLQGVGDRLRSAAFAEIQAQQAFLWAAETFSDAPRSLCAAWKGLAIAEQKHLQWLLRRMKELNIDVQDRLVSAHLWRSFMTAKTAKEFSVYMASAEERGQRAGMRFYEHLQSRDKITAEIFYTIAQEETEHIALAKKFFPEVAEISPVMPSPLQSFGPINEQSAQTRPAGPESEVS